MIMQYYHDALKIISKKRFIVFVTLTAMLAYGFSVMNPTISTDELHADYYIGSGQTMLGAGRFTMPLTGFLMNFSRNTYFNSLPIDLISIVLFIWAAVTFCVLFQRICGNAFTLNTAVFFTCFLISYPLIIEIWEYPSAHLNVCFGYLAIAFALLLIHHALHAQKAYGSFLWSAVLMMFVCAGYETMIVVYICGVFAVLFLQVIFGTETEKTLKGILLQGLCYAGILLVGLVLKILVHRMILTIGNVTPTDNGERSIAWFTRSPKDTLLTTLAGNYHRLLLNSIIYFPITELAGACIILLIIGIYCCRKYNKTIFLPLAGMYLSLILLSLIQGSIPIYRTCQVFGFFAAFVASLIVMILERLRFSKRKFCALLLCGWLCFHQALYVNYFLTLNHQRSESEITVVKEIGHDLQHGFDISKPVIFVGTHVLTDDILEAASIPEDSLRWRLYKTLFLASAPLSPARFNEATLNRKLPESNILSVLAFSIHAHTSAPMHQLFSYHGYDYIPADKDVYYDMAHDYIYANHIPAYPTPGYIQDAGDYIIVHLQ